MDQFEVFSELTPADLREAMNNWAKELQSTAGGAKIQETRLTSVIDRFGGITYVALIRWQPAR